MNYGNRNGSGKAWLGPKANEFPTPLACYNNAALFADGWKFSVH